MTEKQIKTANVFITISMVLLFVRGLFKVIGIAVSISVNIISEKEYVINRNILFNFFLAALFIFIAIEIYRRRQNIYKMYIPISIYQFSIFFILVFYSDFAAETIVSFVLNAVVELLILLPLIIYNKLFFNKVSFFKKLSAKNNISEDK